ncbi:hypothetical protein [Spirosoma foliorum]|uniref:Uncharacterized protein n=1 Tax=Spirosoma foliorum TaxID=2710596 RepID=A0A7G5GXJ3_9BACT|nr:hypothetical protein [Spirosoma foliorum]QMW03585.1 hypothetical protein H3H32_01030 [Spirosoma foliorum]
MTEVTYRYIIDELTKRSIRHDVHSFASGAKMIDIWYDGHFYVIQIDSESVGISEITEDNPGFDTKPDAVFYNSEDAIKQFDAFLL